MTIYLNLAQLKLLARLCSDIARGLFLTALGVPILAEQSPLVSFILFLENTLLGVWFVWAAIKLLEEVEV